MVMQKGVPHHLQADDGRPADETSSDPWWRLTPLQRQATRELYFPKGEEPRNWDGGDNPHSQTVVYQPYYDSFAQRLTTDKGAKKADRKSVV